MINIMFYEIDRVAIVCFPRVSRVQTTGQKFDKFGKKCQNLEFHDFILNHHEKCIQISTNNPSVGLVIPEVTSEIQYLGNPH